MAGLMVLFYFGLKRKALKVWEWVHGNWRSGLGGFSKTTFYFTGVFYWAWSLIRNTYRANRSPYWLWLIAQICTLLKMEFDFILTSFDWIKEDDQRFFQICFLPSKV